MYKEQDGDTISRAEMLKQVKEWRDSEFIRMTNPYHYLEKRIQSIPSITPQPCGDAISRQAVLEQIDQWTIGTREYLYTNATHYLMKRIQDIPSVTPQPCEDAISRQMAIDVLKDIKDLQGRNLFAEKGLFPWNVIAQLPSVTPQQRTGRWIEHFDEIGKWYECDQCHTDWGGAVNYCPNCGCKM